MKKYKNIPFSPPLIGKEEIAEVVDTLRSDWITTGPKTKRFENEFRQYVGARAALAVSSATAALHLALIAHGVGKGDEVITTPMTFCSGVHVIEHVGAKPVLVDVEADTLNIDPKNIEAILKKPARRKKVKAIIIVHYGGHPCNMNAIMKISRRYKIPVVEDAAHSLPAYYKKKIIGSFGNLTAFSFYATKNLTTAEGGMLTGDPKLIEKARIWGLHGMSKDAWNRYSSKGSWYYEVIAPGFKYNLTDIQSSLGLVQLKKLKSFHQRRNEIARRYNRAFSSFDAIQTPEDRAEVKSAWHLYPIRLYLNRLKIGRSEFIQKLKDAGVGASVHFIPIHIHPYYRKKYGYKADNFPVAYREYQRLISLPLAPRHSDQQIDYVIRTVSELIRKFKK